MEKEKKKKGRKPDFTGDGVAVWENTDKNGNTYLTVQLFGMNGIRVNCFRTKKLVGSKALKNKF